MDAISFVLGIQAQTLRGKQLKDLIYRLEGKEPVKGARASVRTNPCMGTVRAFLLISPGASSQVSIMYKTEDDTELLFQRLIKPDGTGEYARLILFAYASCAVPHE